MGDVVEVRQAVGYLRVSTEDQAGEDRYGLAAQQSAITEYADKQGIEIVGWYRDEGFSGSTLDRPGLQEILSSAAADEFDSILIARTDRIARDLFIQLWIEKELAKYGVDIVSVGEPFHGTDPMTVAFRQMAGVFAELEKHRIKERMSAGRKQKARGGGYAGGGVPYGYRLERGTKGLLVDETKALTVRRVFELREKYPDWMLEQIADQLNREGRTTATDKPFGKVQVMRVLRRKEFYKGIYSYSGVIAPGQHPAILESECESESETDIKLTG